MIYTVYYTKKNPFMNWKGSTSQLVTKNKDGDLVKESRNKKNNVPGSTFNYTPKRKYNTQKVQIDLTQKELNELVQKLQWYDKDNKLITEAPIHNGSAPFWLHSNCYRLIENDGMTLNDENPTDEFWLAVMRADKDFTFKGDKGIPPNVKARARYTVMALGVEADEVVNKAMEGVKAQEVLAKMSVDRQIKTLRAMGVGIDEYSGEDNKLKEAFENRVKATLFMKITDEKDAFIGNERNIDMFFRLSNDSKDTNLSSIISHARDNNLISKDRSNKYKYGAIMLGTSMNQVKDFLSDPKNADVLEELNKRLTNV